MEGCKVCRMYPTLQREKKAKMKSMIETVRRGSASEAVTESLQSSLRTFSTTLMDGWALQDQLKGMIDDSFTHRYSTEAPVESFSSFSSSSLSSVARSNSNQ